MKHCWGCKRDLPAEAFHRDKGKRDGLQSKCKKCQYARYKERLAEDPERVRAVARRSQDRHRRRRLYGLTNEQFNALAESQGGRCAICDKVPPLKSEKGFYGGLVVDHDHASGKVRGLLCHNCNRALGLLGDDVHILRAAVSYLDAFLVVDSGVKRCSDHPAYYIAAGGQCPACPTPATVC